MIHCSVIFWESTVKRPAFSIFLAIATLVFNACSGPGIPKGFDRVVWNNDVLGCQGKRLPLSDSILKYKNEWKGMDDDVLIDLLGKPENKHYYERNAKAFSYYLNKGSQCSESKEGKEGPKLIAEINAIGYVHLLRIEP